MNLKRKMDFNWLRILSVLTGFMVVSLLIINGLIIYTWKTANPSKGGWDYALILGSGLNNGSQPSEKLVGRLELGIEYLEQNPSAKVVVSGGKGADEGISEAEAMKNYLVSHGISQERILEESRSTSTLENLKFSKELLQSIDGIKTPRVLLVTSDYHLFRANFLAHRQGIEVLLAGSHTSWIYILKGYGREYFAIIKSAMLDW